MDSNNRVVKAGVGYTIGNFFVKGLNFVTIPIFARLLSTTDYGLYNTYLAYEGIFFSLIGLALQMSLKNAKYRYGDKYEEYVSSIVLFEVILMVVWIAVILVSYKPLSYLMGYEKVILLLLVVHCTSSSILTLYNIHLSLNYSYKKYLIVTGANAVLNIGTSIILILTIFNDERFLGRVLGTVLPLVGVTAIICFFFWKRHKPTIKKKYWRFGLFYSMPLIPHAISQVLLNQFDRIMIKEMVGASYAGIYSFAYNIFMIISVVMISLDNVWSPWFYENYQKGYKKAIKIRSVQYVKGMLLLTLLIMLISPELVQLLGTADYYEAIYCVIPICAGGFFMFIYTIPAQVEYYMGKTYYIAFGTACAAFIKILLNLLFIPRYGYFSAAYTTEFAFILYAIFHFLISKKLDGTNLFDNKGLLIMSLICIVVSLFASALVEYYLIRWIGVVGVLFYYTRRNYNTIKVYFLKIGCKRNY